MHSHEAAAVAAQSAATEARDAAQQLLRLAQAGDRPATWDRLQFTAQDPLRGWSESSELPSLSFGIYNPSQFNLYIGIGNSTPRANSGAMAVPAETLLVLPLAIGYVEIGIDPADQAPLSGGDAIAWGLRFVSVQPAFLGSVT